MKTVPVVGLLWLGGICALGQTGSDSVFTVAGVVVDQASGQPASGVKVTIAASSERRDRAGGTTEADGVFRFEGLKAGKYRLTARPRNSWPQTFGQTGTGNAFGVAVVTGPGQDTEHLVFRLLGSGVISGKVVDDGGDPVNGADVQLLRTAIMSGRRSTSVFRSGVTNDQGEYRFFALPPGDYYVTVTGAPWYGAPDESEDLPELHDTFAATTFAARYYPDTPDATAAQPISIRANADMKANFTMVPVPGLTLTIRVSDESAGEVPRVRILRQTPGGPEVVFRTGYVNDSYRAVLPPGRYTVEAGDSKRNWAREQVDLSYKNVELTSTLRPWPTLSGRLELPGATKLPDGLMFGVRDRAILKMGIRNAGADGSFSMFVAPGHFCPFVSGVRGYYIKEFKPDAGLAADGCVDFGAAEEMQSRVILGNDGGTVKGVVKKSSKPLVNAMVLLVPLSHPEHATAYVTDSDGSYEFTEIPPDGYSLFAVADGSALEYSKPQALAPLLPGGVRLQLAPRQSVERILEVPE